MQILAPIEKDYCDYWPKAEKTTRFEFDLAASPLMKHPEDWRAAKFKKLERGALSHSQGVYHAACSTTLCPTSEFCLSARINFAAFDMSASQRKRYQHFRETVDIDIRPGNQFDPDIFGLYKRYVAARHSDTRTTMTRYSAEDYKDVFGRNAWTVSARKKDGGLLAASIIDQYGPDFCIEYQIYNTDEIEILKKISPGKAMIRTLASVMGAQNPEGHLYMGSLSPDSPKLGYKAEFIGTEVFRGDGWVPYIPA